MDKQQIKEVALSAGFKLKPQEDGTEDLNPYVYQFALALLQQTPSAMWRVTGKADPHPDLVSKERNQLSMGHLNDDQLANAVFIYGDTGARAEETHNGVPVMSIAFLTAAKDRIRWLSRKLESATAAINSNDMKAGADDFIAFLYSVNQGNEIQVSRWADQYFNNVKGGAS